MLQLSLTYPFQLRYLGERERDRDNDYYKPHNKLINIVHGQRDPLTIFDNALIDIKIGQKDPLTIYHWFYAQECNEKIL